MSKCMFPSKVKLGKKAFTVTFSYEKLKHILFYENIRNALLSETLLSQTSYSALDSGIQDTIKENK